VVRVLEVPEEGEEVAMLGTLYKESKLKPSILDEYVKDKGALAQQLGEPSAAWERQGLGERSRAQQSAAERSRAQQLGAGGGNHR
jgi:hypothetical protein